MTGISLFSFSKKGQDLLGSGRRLRQSSHETFGVSSDCIGRFGDCSKGLHFNEVLRFSLLVFSGAWGEHILECTDNIVGDLKNEVRRRRLSRPLSLDSDIYVPATAS